MFVAPCPSKPWVRSRITPLFSESGQKKMRLGSTKVNLGMFVAPCPSKPWVSSRITPLFSESGQKIMRLGSTTHRDGNKIEFLFFVYLIQYSHLQRVEGMRQRWGKKENSKT
jgi:hypothetical protein